MRFIDRQLDVVCLTYHSSEQSRNRGIEKRFVSPRICLQGLIARHKDKSPAKTKHTNKDPSSSAQGSADANEAGRVRFWGVMVDLVTTAYVLLGTANE